MSRLVFDLFERFWTGGKVMRYLVDHGIRMPLRVPGGPRKGELEWHRINRIAVQSTYQSNPRWQPMCMAHDRSIAGGRNQVAPAQVAAPFVSRMSTFSFLIGSLLTSVGSNINAIKRS
ncbi:hypothetical protein GWG65_36515 [Bradyrhizobium sp. CSA207]|uniref:hypothetical protein n=1 Tax=Bradyrhizobium sp. CSA207 TaxID=2698826 RepID=UPI0023B11460|nr:hypothetical protein [Bradyrhizobium sp. CSA207]MDE5446763.1 hypothetical protein [Bradyrhizobium sp. CSA207]